MRVYAPSSTQRRRDTPPFGFSPDDARAEPWLPQPAAWTALTAAAQSGEPDSTLELYRAARQRATGTSQGG